MRNLTLSIIALAACLLIFTNVQTQAGEILFDFSNDGGPKDSSQVSAYMSRIMGSQVTVYDAIKRDNADGDPPFWGVNKGNANDYLRTDYYNTDMEFIFDKPIVAAKGDGYIFDVSLYGCDFRVSGYDSTYDKHLWNSETPNPSALVNKVYFNANTYGEVSFDVLFDRPVSLLVISEGFSRKIAIDNLSVQPVPVPGAALLGMLGMGITGWLKRRNTL